MGEYIDRTKFATTKARAIRKKILQHKKRFRELRKNRNPEISLSQDDIETISRQISSNTTHSRFNGNNVCSPPFNFIGSTIGTSQYSRLADFTHIPGATRNMKIGDSSNQNKENRLPRPLKLKAAATNCTPLGDISSAVANQRPLNLQSSCLERTSSNSQ
jgi:hypothetical protein